MKRRNGSNSLKKHGRAAALLCGLTAALLPAAARADIVEVPDPIVPDPVGGTPELLSKLWIPMLVVIVAAALFVILRKKKRG